jgi:hypothetical protein
MAREGRRGLTLEHNPSVENEAVGDALRARGTREPFNARAEPVWWAAFREGRSSLAQHGRDLFVSTDAEHDR